MFRFFIFISLLLTSSVLAAQTVVGKWKTYDVFDKKKEEAIVDIRIIKDSLYVRIEKIIPKEHRLDICKKCTDHRKNQPITGMIILSGSTLKNGIWKGSKILNAKNGKQYGCHISLDGPDLLKIRGFVGYPIFGKTIYWTRVKTSSLR